MDFRKDDYSVESLTIGDETIRFRAFRNRVYVGKPVKEKYQKMHIFAPECYFEGKSINGYTLDSAPILMPNWVGAYLPGEAGEPGKDPWSKEHSPNTLFRALQHGYVVAAVSLRGRILKDHNGLYVGKAPACIVDYKAAVRYLRYFGNEIPGNPERIITNGTSAGGALSALVGATGDHPDYDPYLEAVGAADTSDRIFAASCYCPITNLDHSDMAYEWQFAGINSFHRMHMVMNEGGRPDFSAEDGMMTEEQIRCSEELSQLFPEYVNRLQLTDESGNSLTLSADGSGSFMEYMKKVILDSAQKALEQGKDLSNKQWLSIENGKAVAMDWYGFASDITRMKTAPSFDYLTNNSPENNEFGTAAVKNKHFTPYSHTNSKVGGEMADSQLIRMLNPMEYIREGAAKKALHWRIRHGQCDRDTSLAISAMLYLMLKEQGLNADYHAPWNVPHSGDYDLDELFCWIDNLCK